MKLVLAQEPKSKVILSAVQTLCKAEKVDFEKMAATVIDDPEGKAYQKLYHKLAAKYVEVELLESICAAVQGKRRGRRVSLVNNSELTIVSSGGLRIKLYGDE